MPEIGDDGSVHYSMDADHFARAMGTLLQAGARNILDQWTAQTWDRFEQALS